MKHLAKGYDWLSYGYDALAKFIIGKAVQDSQRYFLHYLANKRRLLILGGGTGWILSDLAKINSRLQIDYIDVSPRMIMRAKSRLRESTLEVKFICGTESDIPDHLYDSVMTGFYLDHFTNRQVDTVIRQITSRLDKGAIWLVTDFCTNNARQRLYTWVMYIFFRLLTGIKTMQLPSWQSALEAAGGKVTTTRTWYQKWIRASVYQF